VFVSSGKGRVKSAFTVFSGEGDCSRKGDYCVPKLPGARGSAGSKDPKPINTGRERTSRRTKKDIKVIGTS